LVTWLRKVSVADLFTLGNGLLGFFAITYMLDDPPRPVMASISILVAMVFDGLDGVAARVLGSKHSVGHYLDSFSDLISFAMAPAALIYFSYYVPGRYSPTDLLAALAAFAFLTLGALRLARFARGGHEQESFSGLPTPAATFLVLMLLAFFGPTGASLAPLPGAVVASLGLAISVAMVLDVPYPKIRTAAMGGLALSGIGLAVVGFATLELGTGRSASYAALVGSLVLILAYAIAAPLIERGKRGGDPRPAAAGEGSPGPDPGSRGAGPRGPDEG
jgi:CDP-diacylglycerol--serine O-phosphatidyltransferase